MTGDELGLVADIGRHSVRFGLTGEGDLAPREIRRFNMCDHPTFTSALVLYLGDLGLQDRRLPSALAVAGAARGDLINLTGSRWYISLTGVEAVLRRPPCAINECVANALALPTLAPDAFVPLHGPPPAPVRAGGNYLVIGPGTGLGVAALVTAGGRLVPIASEAGHMAMAPDTPEERRFAGLPAARGTGASHESLLSAGGLLAAYRLFDGHMAATPEEVSRGVAHDPAARAAARLFAEYLGALAGDLVLAFGTWDGVFLTGPIVRALQAQLADPGVHRRMTAKDAFRRQLAEVPVALVTRKDLELTGAAAALHAA